MGFSDLRVLRLRPEFLRVRLLIFLLTLMPFATPQAENLSKNADLEEVLVTAFKREQLAERVPVSLMVLDAADLQRGGAATIESISDKVPNLTIDNAVTLAGSSAATSIYIRGIGQSDFLATTDPGVGLYLDDVYISRSIGSLLRLADIEQVEVLRGPQGTLYGKNTIGGAIKLRSHRPEAEKSLLTQITVGSDNRIDSLLRASGGISDNTNASISLARFTQDGYVDRPATGDQLGEVDSTVGRFSLLSDINREWEVFFSADATRNREMAGAATLVDTFELCPSGVAAPFCDGNSPEGAPPGQVFFFNNVSPVTERAGGVPGESRYDGRWVPQDKDLSFGTAEAISNLDIWGAQTSVRWQGESLEFRSITALRALDAYFTRDADHSPYQIYFTSADVQHRQFSQELQLSGHGDDFNWLTGLYYLSESADDDSRLYLASLDIQSGGQEINSDSLAAFAQVEYAITQRWNIILGGRYTRDKKTYLPNQSIIFSHPALVPPQPPSGAVIVPADKSTADFSDPTFNLALQYLFSEQSMLYASYATGFKSGGFVQRNQVPKAALPQFKPETSHTVETGFRHFSPEKRLRMNAAIFHTEYEDIQVRVIEVAGFAPITANAAAAEISGLELDAEIDLGAQWHLNLAAGYLDARYTDIGQGLADIAVDSQFVNTPEWSGVLGLHHAATIGTTTLTTRVDWSYQSSVYNDAENTPALYQGAYQLTNFSMDWQPASERWGLEAGARNILDERYIVSGNANRSLGSTVASYNRGRELFLKLRWLFN